MIKYILKKFNSKLFIQELVKNQKTIELNFKEPKINKEDYEMIKFNNKEGFENLKEGKNSFAYKNYENNFNLLSKYYNHEHPVLLSCLNNIGLVLKSDDKIDESIDIFKKVIEGYNGYFGLNHKNTLISLMNLAKLYKEIGRLDESINWYEFILNNNYKEHISVFDIINNKIMLSGCYREIKKYEKNGNLLNEVEENLKKYKPNLKEYQYKLLKSHYYLSKGLTYQFKKEYELAKEFLLNCEEIRNYLFENKLNVELIRIQYYLFMFYKEIKDEKNAKIYQEKIKNR